MAPAAAPVPVRIGCSGWIYKHWRGLFYPEKLPVKRWFEYYAGEFDTVEINNSFYRLPKAETFDAWQEQAPPGFCYAVKVGRFGTHRKKLLDPEPWLARHLERADLLGSHMGPNLLQLPPRWKRSTERLDHFLAVAPERIRWAVEVRDASWLHDDVFEVLARHGAALCIHDLIAGHPWERTTDWTYVRFHGPRATEAPYRGRYDGRRLAPVARRLQGWMEEGTDVFAYFNNDTEGHAVTDAAWLRDHGRPFTHAAAVAKLHSTEAAVAATRTATQVFGGSGFMDETPVARHYRDAKILEIGEGTSEVQRLVISRGLGLPVR